MHVLWEVDRSGDDMGDKKGGANVLRDRSTVCFSIDTTEGQQLRELLSRKESSSLKLHHCDRSRNIATYLSTRVIRECRNYVEEEVRIGGRIM